MSALFPVPVPDHDRFASRLKLPNHFLVTAEIEPPKGTDITNVLDCVSRFKGKVDAVNITDGQSAMMRACPLAVSRVVLEHGIDPIFQITCRDRNRLALQADLLGAAILGVRNVLLLTGDDPKAGDHPEAKPVFDVSSAQLMQVTKGLMEGKDMAGKELTGKPVFTIGAATNPGNPDLAKETEGVQRKRDAGAEFFQTQAVFDVEGFRKFAAAVKSLNVKILAGILLVKSAKMARYMNEHVWGIKVPESIIERFEKADDRKAECVKVTVELIKGIKDVAQGIHLYPLGWDELVPDILREAGIVQEVARR